MHINIVTTSVMLIFPLNYLVWWWLMIAKIGFHVTSMLTIYHFFIASPILTVFTFFSTLSEGENSVEKKYQWTFSQERGCHLSLNWNRTMYYAGEKAERLVCAWKWKGFCTMWVSNFAGERNPASSRENQNSLCWEESI